MITLNPEQALAAVSGFIELYVIRVNPPDHFLGDLLSDIQLFADGSTADPAARNEWLDAVENATGTREDARMNSDQVLKAMRIFVGRYGARLNNNREITDFLAALSPLTSDRRVEWLACVEKARLR